MQTTFVLEMNFNDAAAYMNICPAYTLPAVKELVYTYDPAAKYKLRAFCETSGSVRAVFQCYMTHYANTPALLLSSSKA